MLHKHLTTKYSWYSNWHGKNHHRHIHWITLMMVFFVSSFLIISGWWAGVGEQNKIILRLSYLQARSSCTHYASPGGTGDGSLNKPWTIKQAFSSASPGDVVCFRDGIYQTQGPQDNFEISVNGTSANRIIFMNYSGETPIIDGSNNSERSTDGGIRVGGDYVTISGFEIRNFHYMLGVKVVADNFIFENNYVHDNADHDDINDGSGVKMLCGSGSMPSTQRCGDGLQSLDYTSNMVVRNNIFWGNGTSHGYDHNMYIQGSNHIIERNISAYASGNGISIRLAKSPTVTHNTMYENYLSGITSNGIDNGKYYNNIIVGGENAMLMTGGSGNDYGYNLIYSTDNWGGDGNAFDWGDSTNNTIEADPRFVDPPAGETDTNYDFHLQYHPPTAEGPIDTGKDWGQDYQGDAPDRGKYEYGASTNPPNPKCGDNSCNNGETCSTCEADCGVCSAPPPSGNTNSNLNCSGVVDIYDFGILMSCWENAYINNPNGCAANAVPAVCASPDITGDGVVGVEDLGAMLSCWGQTCDSSGGGGGGGDVCGDGTCNNGETTSSCPADCPGGTTPTCTSCNVWQDGACGDGSSCQTWQREQTRTCPGDTSGCSLTQCVTDTICGTPPGGTGSLNPSYPRIGQVYFYSLGAGDEVWKNHDFMAIRHNRSSDAAAIKAKNPDIFLMGANDAIEGTPIETVIGKKLPEEWFIHYDNGDRLPIWGGYLMNTTDDCPVVDFIYGPQKFNQFVAQYLVDNTDWNYFDGSYFDSWIAGLTWMGFEMDRIDLNNDGIAEGSNYVSGAYDDGNEIMVNNLRALIDRPIIPHEGYSEYYANGNAFEFWTQIEQPVNGHNNNLGILSNFESQAITPHVNYCNSEAGLSDGNYFGPLFRADFTSALLTSCFFGHDEGTSAHRWSFMHDEYEADLGYPISDKQELESGLWIRYFDNGVVISNLSGQPKTVSSSQLDGRTYYRFQGNQNPTFNNGSQFNSITLDGAFDYVDDQGNNQTDIIDGIMLLTSQQVLITPIIIDNEERNMTTLGQNKASYSGSWAHENIYGSRGYYMAVDWGENSVPYAYSKTQGDTATYKAKINVSGEYRIYEWHSNLADDGVGSTCGNVSYSTSWGDSGFINQGINSGQWNQVTSGPVYLNSGISTVTLTAPGVCAAASDAIKWVYID